MQWCGDGERGGEGGREYCSLLVGGFRLRKWTQFLGLKQLNLLKVEAMELLPSTSLLLLLFTLLLLLMLPGPLDF